MMCAIKNCEREALDEDVNEGKCILHSPDPEKDLAAFNREIQRIIDSAGKVEKGRCDFTRCIFPGGFNSQRLRQACRFACDFDDCHFLGHVSFDGYVFDEESSFYGSVFHDEAFFEKTNFVRNVDLSHASFNGIVVFQKVVCERDIRLVNAKFEADSYIVESTFKGSANFTALRVGKSLLLAESVFDGLVNFEFIDQSNNAPVQIHNINLCNWSFEYADLRRIDFDDISFVPNGNEDSHRAQRKRLTLYDETEIKLRMLSLKNLVPRAIRFIRVLFRAKKKFFRILNKEFLQRRNGYIARVERSYRHLKFNFEANKDYAFAGQFYFGEMEMKRLQKGWFRQIPFVLYKGLSGYGERYMRSFFVLLIMIGFFGLGFMFAGFENVGQGVYVNAELPWNWHSRAEVPSVLDWLESSFYAAESMTLFKQPNIKFLDFNGELVRFFSAIFGALQFGLFALALRRQFKR